ncbi:MAG: alkaline phosphatase family protein [Kiritimatiellae bacterium]|nr:alkaline phosphatase family protein [Kiritimatiellia bacterium]
MIDANKYTRRDFLKLAATSAVLATGFPAFLRSKPAIPRRVVILGIDGMDPKLVQRFIREGFMPNCRRLTEINGLKCLQTSSPPQSPVAWSGFISGANPGVHGIFDFIHRNPSTLAPFCSMGLIEPPPHKLTVGSYILPVSSPKMQNFRQGKTLWVELEKHGINCTALRVPVNIPPTPTHAKTLSGMGTPDLYGSHGFFTLFTDDTSETARDVAGGRIERVTNDGKRIVCHAPGIQNPFRSEGHKSSLVIYAEPDSSNRAARIKVQNTDIKLKEGEWSNWIQVTLSFLPYIAEASAICRFYLKSARNPFSLYLSPLNIDPANPALPISTPSNYAPALARDIGLFYTQGLPEETRALSAGALSDDDYRHQAVDVLREQQRLFESEYHRFNDGFFFFHFSSLDANSHMFWRAFDQTHTAYSPALAKRHGDFIPWLYKQMDRLIGTLPIEDSSRTLILIMSDHGFAPFSRQFHLNAWLRDQGYLMCGQSSPDTQRSIFNDCDWKNTRAYGIGMNALYLNIKGREPYGIVPSGSAAEQFKEELKSRLLNTPDPMTGEPVFKSVYKASELYAGPCAGQAPDLVLGYAPPFRISWESVLGGINAVSFSPNTDPWSGDHTVEADCVPGILLANRSLGLENPAITDLAPFIASTFDVPATFG